MRVDWCVSSWFRIKNSLSLSGVVRQGGPDLLVSEGTLCAKRGHPRAAQRVPGPTL